MMYSKGVGGIVIANYSIIYFVRVGERELI